MKQRKQPHRPVLETIEPRILYSADLSAGLIDNAALADHQVEQRTLNASGEFVEASALGTQLRRHELVFVDSATPDYRKLVDDIGAQSGEGREMEVVVLSGQSDGVQQISAALAQRRDIGAVHILSHGSDGSVQLGSSALNFDSLLTNATQIKRWGQALSADADLLIYGCNVAGSEQGRSLIEALARLTGADVAASDDLTGAADQGGDWDLEYRNGSIETAIVFGQPLSLDWTGTLQSVVVTNANDNVNGTTTSISALLATPGADGISLREAITAANNTTNSGGPDRIDFNIAGPQTINLGSALPDIVDAVVIDGTTDPDFAGTPIIEVNGTSAGASASGLFLSSGSSGSTIRGLVIHNLERHAIRIEGSSNNTIAGNFLGTDASGTAAAGNLVGVYIHGTSSSNASANNRIGGTTAADRNIISANTVDGVQIWGAYATNNTVEGNYIGLNKNGTIDLGNTNQGVAIFGGATNNTVGGTVGNVISGNNQAGVRIVGSGTAGNLVSGNWIGTDEAGTASRANGQQGVYIGVSAADNTVAGNTIAYNTWDGVGIDTTAGTGNSISANAIFANAELGIDLGLDGVTANDGTTTAGQPNLLMDFPVVQTATLSGTTLTVSGYIGTAPNDADFAGVRVELFKTSDAAGVHGEGRTYLGFLTANGNGNFSGTLTVSGFVAGDRITATATDPANNTSEFGVNFMVGTVSAPVASDDSYTVSEDGVLTVTAPGTLGNDSDADGDPLTVLYYGSPANGAVAVSADGSFTYTPAFDYSGSDSFGYVISDGPSGTTHYWGLDGDASDAVGANDGAVSGAPTVPGHAGNALSFDETDDHATIPDVAYPNEFTLSFWFRVDDNTGSDFQYIYSHGTIATPHSLNVYISEDGFATPNMMRTRILDANDTDDIAGLDVDIGALGLGVIGDGQWHQYTVTVASGVGSKVYIDGVLGASNGNGGDPINPVGSVRIGARNDLDPARFYGGRLDALQMFGRSLSGSEVATAHASGTSAATVSITVNPVNDAPALATGSVLAYTENQAATAINTVITTSDPDNPTLASGTVSITANFASGQDVLDFVNVPATMGNIAAVYNAGTGVMTLTSAGATATLAQWQAALRAVQYSNNSDSPSTSARTVSYTVNDGTANSNTVASTVNVAALNDAPVLANTVVTLNSVNEDAGAPSGAVGTLISSLVSGVSDVDGAAVKGIAITGADAANGTWWYSTDNGGSWNALGLPTAASSRLLASDPNTRMYFQSNANFYGTLASAITFRAWDQTSGSNGSTADTSTNGGATAFSIATDTATMTINAFNDAPTGAVSISGTATEDQVLTADTSSMADADGLGVLSYQWTRSTDGGSSWNAIAGAGVATYTLGDADVGNLVRVAVSYTDGQGTAESLTSVGVGPVANANDPPTFSNLAGDAVGYVEGDGALVIEQGGDAAVTDIDSSNFDGGTLTVFISAGGVTAEDVLSLRNQGSGAGQIGLSGSTVTYQGTTIGTVSGGTSGTPLTVTFNPNATPTAVTALVRSVTYRNTDPVGATIGTRTVSFTMTDGDGATSASSTVTVVVNAASAPVAADDGYSLNEDNSLSVSWWNTAWTRRQQITFTGNTFGGAENLSDFPVLITLNSGTIDYTQTQNAGQDLRFFDTGATPLAYEIEKWDETGNSYVWVKVPQVGTTGTESIWMYYGNASAPAGQDSSAVWSGNGFRAVYHLSDTGPAVTDATPSAFDGTATNGPTSTGGQIGGALRFDGGNDYVSLGNDLPVLNNIGSVTLSAWVNIGSESSATPFIAVSRYNGGIATSNSRVAIEQADGEVKLIARSTDDDSDVANMFTTTSPFTGQVGVWHYISGVIDYSTNGMAIFVDGVQQATAGTANFANSSTPNSNSADASIGSQDDGSGGYFAGSIDEARIAGTARSAAWIEAEYLTMTGGFLTVGTTQVVPGIAGVLSNDTSYNGQPLSAMLVSGPTHAASFTLYADGTFNYTPVANYVGSDLFTYRANDGGSNSSTATVTLTINPVNDSPASTVPGAQSTNEDVSLTFSTPNGNALSVSDVDAGILQVTLSGGNGALTLAGVAGLTFIAGDGVGDAVMTFSGSAASIDAALDGLSFASSADFSGAATLQIDTSDLGSSGSGGILSDSDIVSIAVNPVNDTPAGALIVSGAATEYQTLTADTSNITDVDGLGAFSHQWARSTDGGSTWGAIAGATAATYTLGGADVGSLVRVVVSYTDAQGTGESLMSTAVGPVANVNDAPVAVDDNGVTAADTVLNIAPAGVLGNDSDVDLDALNVIAVQGSAPSVGSVLSLASGALLTLNANGSFSYDPNGAFDRLAAGASTTDGFTYTVGDGNGGTDTASMIITINGVNDAPVGSDATITTLEDMPYVFVSGDFAFADVDTGDSLQSVTVSSLPGAGSLTLSGAAVAPGQSVSLAQILAGSLRFTPAADANGVGYASFAVRVSDGIVDASPASAVTINVSPVNDAPLLSANSLTVSQGGTVVLSGADVVAIDVDSAATTLVFSVSDVNNGRFELMSAPGVTITSFTQAQVSGGQVRFVHDSSASTPSYQVQVSDGALVDGPMAASVNWSPTAMGVGLVSMPPEAPSMGPAAGAPPAVSEAPVRAQPPSAPLPSQESMLPAVFSAGRPEAMISEAPAQALRMATIERAPLKIVPIVQSFNDYEPPPPADIVMQVLNVLPSQLQFTSSKAMDWVVSPAFDEGFRDKAERELQVLIDSVKFGGMALSVGAVWWASRISGLLGSLLASTPAWRHIDPLPVVGRDDEEEDWYEPDDRDADANELAVSLVLEGSARAGSSAD